MNNKNELILIPSLGGVLSDGKIELTQKYLSGVDQFAKYWPGDVTSLIKFSKGHDQMDAEIFDAEIHQGKVEQQPDSFKNLIERLKKAKLVFSFLSRDYCSLAQACKSIDVPLVYGTDYDLEIQESIIDSYNYNTLLSLRKKIYARRTEKKIIKSLKFASGLQCSGTPTFISYSKYNRNPLLFFDSRVYESSIVNAYGISSKLERIKNDPLRLVYGGRLIPMKGVLDLLLVANELRHLGVNFTLDIFGKGELEVTLRNEISRLDLHKQVKLKGTLDYQTEWLPSLKKDYHLFICCHYQSDPSCTYLESMSCGLPTVGYDNRAFRGIVEASGVGWITSMKNPMEMAKRIAEIDSLRSQIESVSIKARDFSLDHSVEKTFKKRVEHLQSCLV